MSEHEDGRRIIVSTPNTTCWIALAALTLILPARGIHAFEDAARPSALTLTDIKVSFQLDPRLTRGLYMGERWVSLPTFVGAGGQDTVLARAEGLDANGKPVGITPVWMPADPEMIEVSPRQGKEVRITVRRAGQSTLNVASPGFSRELIVKAANKGNALQVEISQGKASAGKPPEAGKDPENRKDAGSPKEKVSYTLGYKAGSSLKARSVDLDLDIYVKAFREAFAGDRAAMSEKEMADALGALQKDMKAKPPGKKKESAEERRRSAEKNRKEGATFLAENAGKEGVVTLPSGLQYKIIKEGTGKQPAKADKVNVNYRGFFPAGTEFDNSRKKGKPAVFRVDNVIKGWSEALPLMKEGSTWMLYIPSDLAYGARRAGARIGPNQALVFEVELISVQ
jgi:FKBP-type peptidyl-prolyl cis-trans isomerase FklB